MSSAANNPYQAGNEEIDMWNQDYQKRRVAAMKKRGRQQGDCIDQCLMSITKHLIHVFILVIFVSFIAMGVIVMSAANAPDLEVHDVEHSNFFVNFVNSFIENHPAYYGLEKLGLAKRNQGKVNNYMQLLAQYYHGSDHPEWKMLHPMYVMLQEQSPMGMLRDFQVAEIDMQEHPITAKAFYKDYVSQSLPAVFRREFVDEEIVKQLAMRTDQSSYEDYLQGLFGASQDEIIQQLSPDVRKHWEQGGMASHMKSLHQVKMPINYKRMRIDYGWFIKPTQTYTSTVTSSYASFMQDKKEMDANQYVHYIQDQPLIQFPKMKFEKRSLLAQILRPVNTLYTQWADFLPRRAKKIMNEQHICILKGKELFRMVSPIFRKNLYVGELEKFQHDETPMDFFKPDYERFPYAKQFNFVEVELSAGDCMYVPAYYYIQSRTTSHPTQDAAKTKAYTKGVGHDIETIMIAQQYASHSAFVDVMMDALDKDILTDDSLHSWDASLTAWFTGKSSTELR